VVPLQTSAAWISFTHCSGIGQMDLRHSPGRVQSESRNYCARKIIAELRLNNQKAHELTHTLKNLVTVQRLILEQIRRTPRHTVQSRASITRLSTRRITNELENLAIKVENMKRVKSW